MRFVMKTQSRELEAIVTLRDGLLKLLLQLRLRWIRREFQPVETTVCTLREARHATHTHRTRTAPLVKIETSSRPFVPATR
eukprot:COSAG02_NODE_9865_length_2088_cov_1.550528_2_plen_81_part_00